MSAKQKEAKEVADQLLHLVNTFSPETETFVDTIMSAHRTLQQNTFRLMVECIKGWAQVKKDDRYDDRNIETVLLCDKIVETFGEELYLPTV